MTAEELRQQADTYAARVTATESELRKLEAAITAATAALVDAAAGERRDKAAERSSLLQERESLTAELCELRRRRDASYIVAQQTIVDAARAELDALAAASTEKRREMSNFLNGEYLRFINRGGRVPDTEDAQRERVAMDVKAATLKAESSIAAQRCDKARGVWQREVAALTALQRAV